MRLVHDDRRAAAFSDRAQFFKWRAVAIHAEDALGHHDRASTAGSAERLLERTQILVPEHARRRFRQPDAVDEARVIPLVRENQIVRADEGLQQSDVRRITRSEQQRGLGARKRGEPCFDALEDLVVTTKETGPGRTGRKLAEGDAHRLCEVRMRRETEIVIGNKIDPVRQA